MRLWQPQPLPLWAKWKWGHLIIQPRLPPSSLQLCGGRHRLHRPGCKPFALVLGRGLEAVPRQCRLSALPPPSEAFFDPVIPKRSQLKIPGNASTSLSHTL